MNQNDIIVYGFIALIVLVITLVFLYAIIRETTRELRANSETMLRFKVMEMKKKGFDVDEINAAMDEKKKNFWKKFSAK